MLRNPPDQAGSADEVVVALSRLARAFKARLGEHVDASAAWLLLHHIGESGPLRLSDLAGLACLDHSTVSRHVGHLLDAGAVSKVQDPADRRAWQVELTPAGHAALDEAKQRRAEALAEALTGWSDPDRAALVRLLERLATSLQPEDLAAKEPV